MSDFKKYYNDVTGKIVEYPEDAAALFPALKPVPSEKSKPSVDAENQLDIEIVDNNKKAETKNAK